MIVVDSSAVLAILLKEPEAGLVAHRLRAEDNRIMSVANYVETGAVLAGRRAADRWQGMRELDDLLEQLKIRVVAMDVAQSRLALEARIRYGRGMGQGGVLNLGDAFAYALAKQNNAKLLFIGNDFGTTDIVSALAD